MQRRSFAFSVKRFFFLAFMERINMLEANFPVRFFSFLPPSATSRNSWERLLRLLWKNSALFRTETHFSGRSSTSNLLDIQYIKCRMEDFSREISNRFLLVSVLAITQKKRLSSISNPTSRGDKNCTQSLFWLLITVQKLVQADSLTPRLYQMIGIVTFFRNLIASIQG